MMLLLLLLLLLLHETRWVHRVMMRRQVLMHSVRVQTRNWDSVVEFVLFVGEKRICKREKNGKSLSTGALCCVLGKAESDIGWFVREAENFSERKRNPGQVWGCPQAQRGEKKR